MAKYQLTIWSTVTYRHEVEVEAADQDGAEETARMIFEAADTSTWECVASDFEADVDEAYNPATDDVNETEIIDRMREARFHDNQPPRD